MVDDDPDILNTLASLLQQRLGEGVEVATASTGDEARRRIERGERFDVVLADERMPGTSGSELLAWLRDAQPRTRRVLMSAFYEGFAAQALTERAGAEAFIRKPFQVAALLGELRRMLDDAVA